MGCEGDTVAVDVIDIDRAIQRSRSAEVCHIGRRSVLVEAARSLDDSHKVRSPLADVGRLRYIDIGTPESASNLNSGCRVGAGTRVGVDDRVSLVVDIEGSAARNAVTSGCASRQIVARQLKEANVVVG